jgi:hypothetical protein
MMKRVNDKYIKEIFETSSNYSEWFGYYNYDVVNRNGSKMLCNRVGFDARAITKDDSIDVGYYDVKLGEWYKIGNTDSFNWQQGAMLQWIPGDGNENKVIYNYSDKKHFYSRIVDISTDEEKTIDFPVYCITPDGKTAITLNYERSYWCRAYHYQPIQNPDYDVRVAEDDGIFQVDLESGGVRRIVSIQDVISIGYDPVFKTSKHWLEHIMINPQGSRFVFLHRFSFGNGYRTRIFLANIDGSCLQEIPGWKNKEWSHFGWKGNDEFAIYTVEKSAAAVKYTDSIMQEQKKKSLKSELRDKVKAILPQKFKDKIIGRKKFYEHYVLNNGRFILKDVYDGDMLGIDGHPSFTSDGKYMITDSYPDSKGYQRLIIYNTESKKYVLVGRFYAPLSGNPASCDLHPKLSFAGRYLAIDTAYSGTHKMILFQIKWDAVQKVIG